MHRLCVKTCGRPFVVPSNKCHAQPRPAVTGATHLRQSGSPAALVDNDSAHEALVSATWDAIAVMNALPKRCEAAESWRNSTTVVV